MLQNIFFKEKSNIFLTQKPDAFLVRPKIENMKTFSIRVDKELAEKISRFARIDDRSDAAVIRKALKEFFFKQNSATKKALSFSKTKPEKGAK